MLEFLVQNIGKEDFTAQQGKADSALQNAFGFALEDSKKAKQETKSKSNKVNKQNCKRSLPEVLETKETTDEEEVVSNRGESEEDAGLWETVEKRQIKKASTKKDTSRSKQVNNSKRTKNN